MLLGPKEYEGLGLTLSMVNVRDRQDLAPKILEEYLQGETQTFLMQLNQKNTVLRHCVWTEADRRILSRLIIAGLPEFPGLNLEPFYEARMTFHDLAKIQLDPDNQKAAELLEPELYGRAKANEIGEHKETRDQESLLASLIHPIISSLYIDDLGKFGFMSQAQVVKEIRGAGFHHERPSYVAGMCYARLEDDPNAFQERKRKNKLSVTANMLIRLADLEGLNEERSYRMHRIDRPLQERIIYATLPKRLLLEVLKEINLPISEFSSEELRELIMRSALDLYDRYDVVKYDTRVDCLYGAKSYEMVDQLSQYVWRNHGKIFQERKTSMSNRKEYFKKDPLREITSTTPMGYIPSIGYIQ